MDPVSINSTKTHGPCQHKLHKNTGSHQHQLHKNTWTLLASTAQKHMDPVSINSTKTHGPCQHKLHKNTGSHQHQLHKNTWTLLASTAQKRMDPVNINSTKTHGPRQHQQHKNTLTPSVSTAHKHMDPISINSTKNTWTPSASQKQKHLPLNINYTPDDTKLKLTDDKTKDLLIKSNRTIFLDKQPTSLHVGITDIRLTTCPCNHTFTISVNMTQAHFNSLFSWKAEESAPSSSACMFSNQNSFAPLFSPS